MNKRTPLYDEHVRLGATMVPFGGWDMPVYYSTVIEEHTATRERAGLFDTSHMGEIGVSGPDSLRLLELLVSNSVSALEPGAAVYAAMCNARGGVVDDLWVYMMKPDVYCLVVNASTKDKDLAWIQQAAAGRDVAVNDLSNGTGMVALQGPAAAGIMAGLSSDPLPARFHFAKSQIAGCAVMVSRTGYTGEDGVELYTASGETATVWRALLEAGADAGLVPVGLGARDTLRLEACYSLYGHELSEDITPAEAGVSFAVARAKAFTGSDVILPQIENGPARRVAAFELTGRGIPRDGYPVTAQGAAAGVVTSGCFSPTLKKGIGLAMLQAPFLAPGTDIDVEIRGKNYPGKVVKKPFIKHV